MNEEYWELRALGRNYYDAYRHTTRMNNRLGALAKRGQTSEFLIAQRDLAEQAKKETEKILVRRYRKTAPPAIVAFQKATTGLGEGLMAQLIGCVGDFCTYTEAWWEEASSHTTSDCHGFVEDASSQCTLDSQTAGEKRVLMTGAVRSCGVRDIWAYCGHGDPSRRRRKGQDQSQNFAAGNVLAKTTVHLMAEFALRSNGVPDKNGRPRAMTPYYPLYQLVKADAKDRHPDWTAGHAHNHALRRVGKAILKDIWRVQHGQEPVYGAPTPWTDRRAA